MNPFNCPPTESLLTTQKVNRKQIIIFQKHSTITWSDFVKKLIPASIEIDDAAATWFAPAHRTLPAEWIRQSEYRRRSQGSPERCPGANCASADGAVQSESSRYVRKRCHRAESVAIRQMTSGHRLFERLFSSFEVYVSSGGPPCRQGRQRLRWSGDWRPDPQLSLVQHLFG